MRVLLATAPRATYVSRKGQAKPRGAHCTWRRRMRALPRARVLLQPAREGPVRCGGARAAGPSRCVRGPCDAPRAPMCPRTLHSRSVSIEPHARAARARARARVLVRALQGASGSCSSPK